MNGCERASGPEAWVEVENDGRRGHGDQQLRTADESPLCGGFGY
ncbi:hypothetical protein C731_0492 [Mycolicibacterium hassiacum DSM 44199]|uniref:Uncharacterized protein n=1 Tax=Mycolicibacterium hassiacum (strain DSM 44199 / CIP 105218 / JCM 12690 / 3849) TaxID=1122247 RepID=K5B9J0_MYCHD|nr:hypothetical protein C731_0492 [Mycolicibacterium hassiacum DSM 44199]